MSAVEKIRELIADALILFGFLVNGAPLLANGLAANCKRNPNQQPARNLNERRPHD